MTASRVGVVDPGERAADEPAPESRGDRVEPVTLGRPRENGSATAIGRYTNSCSGRQERALDAVAREVAQREQGLQAGDAAAGDQHAKLTRDSHGHIPPGTDATDVRLKSLAIETAPDSAFWHGPLGSRA